jgi:hypothetical protein
MTTTTAIGRGERGHFLPGHNVNGGGRPKLPDWFKSSAEDCLRVLVACATGKVQEGDPPAALEVATSASPKERIHAAELVCNRVLGKAPETITVDGQSGVMDLLIALAKPVAPKDP